MQQRDVRQNDPQQKQQQGVAYQSLQQLPQKIMEPTIQSSNLGSAAAPSKSLDMASTNMNFSVTAPLQSAPVRQTVDRTNRLDTGYKDGGLVKGVTHYSKKC
jgi:hypothetical protein